MDDFITRLRRAMDYIEANLTEEIDWEAAARLSLLGGYQFARVFSALTDITPGDYVRMRRLTLAAQDLAAGGRVLDVALRYGYASPTAFTRAFALFHGITPSAARKHGALLTNYPPMSFQFSIQGGTPMQYRIEEKPAYRFLGFGEAVSLVDGENFRRIPQLWNEMTPEKWAALEALADGRFGKGCFGVMRMVAPQKMLYIIGTTSDAEPAEGMEAIAAPAHLYAVFPTPMSEIQANTRRIYAEWLPHSGYELSGTPEMEYYPDADMSDATQYIVETWVPVRKR
ncbi:MAG: AraC family transcriptional regulator [Oscillospiraceae bacterium]|jgi:AraC family transcriptional regulator|nr:AraC family transcriptional regulator [Oscillospiraceae bacterium]